MRSLSSVWAVSGSALAAPIDAQVTPFNMSLKYQDGAEDFAMYYEEAAAVWEEAIVGYANGQLVLCHTLMLGSPCTRNLLQTSGCDISQPENLEVTKH